MVSISSLLADNDLEEEAPAPILIHNDDDDDDDDSRHPPLDSESDSESGSDENQNQNQTNGKQSFLSYMRIDKNKQQQGHLKPISIADIIDVPSPEAKLDGSEPMMTISNSTNNPVMSINNTPGPATFIMETPENTIKPSAGADIPKPKATKRKAPTTPKKMAETKPKKRKTKAQKEQEAAQAKGKENAEKTKAKKPTKSKATTSSLTSTSTTAKKDTTKKDTTKKDSTKKARKPAKKATTSKEPTPTSSNANNNNKSEEPPRNPHVHIEKPVSIEINEEKKNVLSEQAKVVVPIVKQEPTSTKITKLSDLLNSDDDKIIEVMDEDEDEDDDEDDEKEVDLDDEEDEDDNYGRNIQKKTDIPLIFDIPLNKVDENGRNNLDNGQVIINVMKLAEDKYGFKTIHPNANFALDDLFADDDNMDMTDNPLAAPGNSESNELLKEFKKNQLKLQKEKEEKLQEQLELQQGQKDIANSEESEKKIRQMIARNNRKIGKYDYADPFIDDEELLWEETRAVTQDGFFVYWGPLVDESSAKHIMSRDPQKYVNKGGKLVKKYRNKPGPKSKKEKEAIERQNLLKMSSGMSSFQISNSVAK